MVFNKTKGNMINNNKYIIYMLKHQNAMNIEDRPFI